MAQENLKTNDCLWLLFIEYIKYIKWWKRNKMKNCLPLEGFTIGKTSSFAGSWTSVVEYNDNPVYKLNIKIKDWCSHIIIYKYTIFFCKLSSLFLSYLIFQLHKTENK